jgi:hypothetical protein
MKPTRAIGAGSLTVLVAVLSSFAARPEAQAYGYRKVVTVNPAQVSGPTPLLDFPVLVSVVDPDLRTIPNGGRVEHPNGYDIIFRLLDGTNLDFEVERYIATSGTLVAWVRIPALDTATQFYMIYGDSNVSFSQEDAIGVWNANYVGVWHLTQTSTAAVGEFLDSTSNNHDAQGGQGNAARIPNVVASKIDRGQNFDGDLADDHIALPSTATLDNAHENDYTLEAWFRPDVTPPGGGAPLSLNNNYYGIIIKYALPHFGIEYSFQNKFEMLHNPTSGQEVAITPGTFAPGSYYHVVGTVSRASGEVKLYVNGVFQITATFPPGTGTAELGTLRWRFGIADDAVPSWGWPANGQVDEARISNVTRLPGWITTSYNSQNTPATFLTFGAEIPTEVKLIGFSGEPRGVAVALSWETASELSNLGFHVYRAEQERGPYERLTTSLIPGLGSSPVGARYSFEDRGVVPGKSYFYKLEDVDRTGTRTTHGPVAIEVAASTDSGTVPDGDDLPVSRITYGRPEDNGLRLLQKAGDERVYEFVTHGFYVDLLEDGASRVWIPGFDDAVEAGLSMPVKRALLDAVVGRKSELRSVRAEGVVAFSGLPAFARMELSLTASRDAVVRPNRRLHRDDGSSRGLRPEHWAELADDVFQGDEKKALVQLYPVRYDGRTAELLLAQRLVLRLAFHKPLPDERVTADGRARRRALSTRRSEDDVIVRLVAREPGLYAVRYEDLFGRRHFRRSEVNLSRQGSSVPFHVEPAGAFAPGATLYFLSEGEALNPHDREAVYELSPAPGSRMKVVSPKPEGPRLGTYLKLARFEEDRYYQAGLIHEEELWLWDTLLSASTKEFPFQLTTPVSSEARIRVRLQGISDEATLEDHHVRIRVNGAPAAEARWDGSQSIWLQGGLPAGLLRDGDNVLEIENVGDTEASYSMTMLDKFQVEYERVLEPGSFNGAFAHSGIVELPANAMLLRKASGEPDWQAGVRQFSVEPGYSYSAFTAAISPELRRPRRTGLASWHQPVDWMAVAPRGYLPALGPLVEWRRQQGLSAKSVALEDVYETFGHGEKSPEAIKELVDHAFHRWGGLRYVLLVGDATYDPKNRLGTGKEDLLPSKVIQTSYLWTASDPWFGAVNGSDPLPDVAIGRLPVASASELRGVVAKILEYERREWSGDRPFVLITDNADSAGNFRDDALQIATEFFGSSPQQQIHLDELPYAEARRRILAAWGDGARLVSYIGHGGIHLWASEKLLTIDDVPDLEPSPDPPILLSMNCLNGYFHFPYFDALSERLVKSEDRGAVAAFSPSGLSLNEPANQLHRFMMDALVSGRNQRLGDAVLEAQRAYADSGAFPELLAIYHLLGDPATMLRLSH